MVDGGGRLRRRRQCRRPPAAAAAPGGVVVSETVREHVANKLDLTFEDLGPQMLKNIERPVRVHRVVPVPGRTCDAMAPAAANAEPRGRQSRHLFLNISGDAEQEYFSDGISEDLITDLSKVSGLFVLAELDLRLQGQAGRCARAEPQAERPPCPRRSCQGRRAGAHHRPARRWRERRARLGRALRPRVTDIFAVQYEITREHRRCARGPAPARGVAGIGCGPTTNVEAYQH